jgi:chromosome segregation ATPase
MEYQQTFLQNKIQNYQETLDESQTAREKLERDLEKQFSMEADFDKLKDRNAKLDIEILNSTQEIQKLQADNKRMERDLRRAKKRNEELEKEAMEARSDKAEITVELEKAQNDLVTTQEKLAKKTKELITLLEQTKGILGDNKESANTETIPKEAQSSNIEQSENQVEAKSESIATKTGGNEAELKKKLFELKKGSDSLQVKVDVRFNLSV